MGTLPHHLDLNPTHLHRNLGGSSRYFAKKCTKKKSKIIVGSTPKKFLYRKTSLRSPWALFSHLEKFSAPTWPKMAKNGQKMGKIDKKPPKLASKQHGPITAPSGPQPTLLHGNLVQHVLPRIGQERAKNGPKMVEIFEKIKKI